MPHLIVFSHLRWSFLYQRPQQLLSRLARHFPVLYVEEPLRAAGAEPALEAACAAPGVTVLQPHLPSPADGFDDDALAALRPLIAGHLRARGIVDYVAWFCTPLAWPVLDSLNPRAVVYDCPDEFAAPPQSPAAIHQRDAALLRAADLVLAAGPSLFEAKRQAREDVLCVPNAVDAAHFAPQPAAARLGAMLQAEHVQGRIPGPRLGFFGAIDERLDMRLIETIADAEPDWQVLLAGPIVGIDESALPQRANVHWLGPQPHSLLPQLVADWDVCLLPFASNERTRCLNPTQTLEYMAAEKPIVSTALHDVVAMHGDVVRVGHDHQAFVEGCRWALSETGYKRAERIGEMLSTVSRFSWDGTAGSVLDALHTVLATLPVPQPQPDDAVEQQPIMAAA